MQTMKNLLYWRLKLKKSGHIKQVPVSVNSKLFLNIPAYLLPLKSDCSKDSELKIEYVLFHFHCIQMLTILKFLYYLLLNYLNNFCDFNQSLRCMTYIAYVSVS